MTKLSSVINKKGFTLIELIIIIGIMSILSLITVISLNNYISTANLTTDLTNVRTLNNVTQIFRLTNENSDPFIDESNSSQELMEVLVTNEILQNSIEPLTADASFVWSFEDHNWYLIDGNAFYTILDSDGLTVNNNGRLSGSFTSGEKDVLLLSELSGIKIKELYQDIFKNKGLTSFVFSSDSIVTRIHARAFQNNELSTITFPDTLQRIDLLAFKDNNFTELVLPESLVHVEQNAFQNNNITKITVGSKLNTIGNSAFGINNAGFAAAYQAGGAGTYVYINNVWVKQ